MTLVEDDGVEVLVVKMTEGLGQVQLQIPKSTQLRTDISNSTVDLRQALKDAIRADCDYYSIISDIALYETRAVTNRWPFTL